MPSREVSARLQSVISCLSARYHTPSFEPHVTLLGGVVGSEGEIVSKTADLASIVRRYSIELGDVAHSDAYFKCLFLMARETDEVMRANLDARKAFNRSNDPAYMPHLSLMYGDFATEMKEQMIREIGNQGQVSFDVSSVYLFSTNGGPDDWRRVLEFSLQ